MGIKYREEAFMQAKSKLYSLGTELADCLGKLPSSVPGRSGINSALRSCRRQLKDVAGHAQSLSANIGKAAAVLNGCEEKLLAVPDSGAALSLAGGWYHLTQSQGGKLFVKMLSEAGIPGSLAAILLSSDAKAWSSLVGKVAKSSTKLVETKWANYKGASLTDVLGKRVTKNDWKSVLGLDKYLKNPSQATKWTLKMKRNFSKAFGSSTDFSKLSNKLGLVASYVGSGIDNFQEYRDGDISADRAIVEFAVEGIGSYALGAAAAAAVAAAGFASAPAVVVGAAAVGVVWGVDFLTKKVTGAITGTEYGLVEGVGHLVGEGYDLYKEGMYNAGKAVRQAGETVVNWVGNLISNKGGLFAW